ncbi:DUF4430 domain-containing protein [Heyndrickxia vini]|uniref:DUF4430 domain-containing protein n=1 Tax=Heyndrickxia vini TaxID=1476025 RepID=A0ABX7DXU4_9BACI|nr:DUF4430 domain-containing protein [Heyndrickxia vini]QQZ08151.1 DUF4430 domain-containing protein [Heyndrickxia vini]
MRILKSFAILLLTSLIIFLIAGCQKDEVKPINEGSKASDITASNTKENDIAKEEDNSKEIEKKKESPVSKTTLKESDNKKEEKENSQNDTNTNKDKNTNNSQTSTEKRTINTEKKQSVTVKKSKETKEENQKQTTQSKETAKQQNNHSKKVTNPQSSVLISVRGDKKTGTILSQTKVAINKGDTLLVVTRNILKEKGIPISVTGSGATAYVQGIANLFEFDLGPMSGWTVKKNGVLLDRSVGAVTVKNGDRIEWIYTTDYSKK